MDTGQVVQQQPHVREVDNNHLAEKDLYQHDPVLRLLKDSLKLNSFWFILGSSVLSIGIFIVAYALAGIPFTPKRFLITILNIFSTVLFFWIYFQLPTYIARLFNTLVDNQVLLLNSPRKTTLVSHPDFLKQFSDWINSYVWLLLPLPFIVAYPAYRLFGPYVSLTPEPFWLRVLGELIDLFIGYAVVLSIVRILVTLFFLNRSFDWFNIRINPLHPDGAGGLGILREVMWDNAGIMLGVALSFYVDSILSSRVVDIMLLIVAYAALIPLLFLSWLFIPHRAMLRARETVLQPLTEEFNKVLSKMVPVANEETAQIAADTERLTELTKRYALWRDTFPVWPLGVAQMYQLLVAFLLPGLVPLFIALLAAIPQIIQFFTKNP
jgi:hypothetical protein